VTQIDVENIEKFLVVMVFGGGGGDRGGLKKYLFEKYTFPLFFFWNRF
jgi:hypothetical protein